MISQFDYFTSSYVSTTFIHCVNRGTILLILSIDDLIITCDNLSSIQELNDFLSQRFEMKDLDNLSYFLDLEIISSFDGLYLTQSKYIHNLLSQVGLIDGKITNTLVELNAHLNLLENHLC